MLSSAQNSPSSNGSSTIRKSYHIRSESSVLKSNRRILTRNRSRSTADNQQKKVTFKKRVNRRFESIAIPELNNNSYPIDDEQEEKGAIPYIRYKSKPITIETGNNSNHYKGFGNNKSQKELFGDMLQEFRNILVPLQTEVESLRKITQKLEKQINILQSENAIQRKQSHYNDESSPNALYIDKAIRMTLSLDDNNINTNSQSVNTRTRARTVSDAIIDNNNDKTIKEMDRIISQSKRLFEDEEHDLEIDGHKGVGSKITNITNFKEDEEVSQIYLDGNLDLLSDVDNNIMPTTPISTPPSTPRGAKTSIDHTYYEKEEESNEPSHLSQSQNPSSPSPLILVPNRQIGITIHKKRSNSHHLRHDDILQTTGILKISTSLPQYTSYKSSYSHDNNYNNDIYHRSNNNNYNYKRNSFVSFV